MRWRGGAEVGRRPSVGRRLILATALALVAGAASAGDLAAAPVNVHLAAGARAAALTLTNTGTAPTAFQIRAFAWGQTATDDPLTATGELLISQAARRARRRGQPDRAPGAAQTGSRTRGDLPHPGR